MNTVSVPGLIIDKGALKYIDQATLAPPLSRLVRDIMNALAFTSSRLDTP